MRAAAVQMNPVIGDVDANLEKADRLVRTAFKEGAQWVVLPEFFTSGMSDDPVILDTHRPIDGEPAQLIKRLAAEGDAVVGGTFLAQRDKDTYNTFFVAQPDGKVFTHDKDFPSGGTESSNFVGGKDTGVFHNLSDTRVGAAICWEQCRYGTAKRLLEGQVDLILASSAWARLPLRKLELEEFHQMLVNAPTQLAMLTGAPVIHANHVGMYRTVEKFGLGTMNKGPDLPQTILFYMGESRIVDGHGRTLANRTEEQGEGIVVHDVEVGRVKPSLPLRDRFWIPDMPEIWTEVFEHNGKLGAEIYRTQTRTRRNAEKK